MTALFPVNICHCRTVFVVVCCEFFQNVLDLKVDNIDVLLVNHFWLGGSHAKKLIIYFVTHPIILVETR